MMIVMMMSMQLCQLLHLPDQAPVQPRQSAGRDPRHGGHPHQHSPGTGSLIMQTGANWSQTSPICLIPRRVHSTPLVMKVYREIVSELLVLAGGHGYNIQRRFDFCLKCELCEILGKTDISQLAKSGEIVETLGSTQVMQEKFPVAGL